MLDIVLEEIEKEVERVTQGWPDTAVSDYRERMLSLNENTTDINKLYRPSFHYVDKETEKLMLMQRKWAQSHNAKSALQ